MNIILCFLHSLQKVFFFLLKKIIHLVVHAYKAYFLYDFFNIFFYIKVLFFLLKNVFCCRSK